MTLAAVHGSQARLMIHDVEVDVYTRMARVTRSVDTHDKSVFGDGWKNRHRGIGDGSMVFEGLFTTEARDSTHYTWLTEQTQDKVAVLAPSGWAVGNRCMACQMRATEYSFDNAIADLVRHNFTIEANDGMDGGVVLAKQDAATGSAAGTDVDDHGIGPTTNGLACYLNVFANDRDGTLDVKVAGSADGVSGWADLANFTQIPASTTDSERVVVAAGTSIPRYLRAEWGITGSTGSCSFLVTAHRRFFT